MRIDNKYYDQIFDFCGQWDMPSKCGLKITDYQDKTVVLVTELYHENPGTSITYAGGNLAIQICEKFHINPHNLIYIECNPDSHSKLSFYDEEFYLVSFTFSNNQLLNPTYSKLSKENVLLYLNF